MLKILYKLYFICFKINYFDKIWERVIIRIVNILLPQYFRLTRFQPSYRLANTEKRDETLIVSLTSFPARIRKVWLTIETILRQTEKPDRIILWLYNEDFNGKESLPKKLVNLEKRGLEIRFCDENLMPHLKYFYTMIEYPDSHVITIDDDVFYPSDLIEKLRKCHKFYQGAIVSAITRQIKVSGNKIMPYDEWQYLSINTEPSSLNLMMGVGGAFYPKGSIHPDAFKLDNLKRMSLKTDDIWLKFMSLKSKTAVASISGEFSRFFIPLIIENNRCLMSDNINKGTNVIVLQNLLNHYKLPLSILDGECKKG